MTSLHFEVVPSLHMGVAEDGAEVAMDKVEVQSTYSSSTTKIS